ncbi:hypothetical protein Apa02nite_026000 [Actinoplanes palleronii]|uniref:Uncharacterized protein n=1 Tax=Actinoplanes palleronii TaxID=113570 RepID=A0ABQ4B7D0_9ACTN|nr:hypothetical protein Apa02nite_026000 [Actinoplanes palleronii]
MIVVSPSTGTSAFGSVSVYGRNLRPAPAASTRPIMGWILPTKREVCPGRIPTVHLSPDFAQGDREVDTDGPPGKTGRGCF